jgi:hypothetical protein
MASGDFMSVWFRATALSLTALCAFGGWGCGSDGAAASTQGQDPPVSDTPPEGPGKDDSPTAQGYAIEGARGWTLIGNELTVGHDTYELAITPPSGVKYIDMWIDGTKGTRLKRDGTVFRASASIAALSPGAHEVLLASNGQKTAFARLQFQRSHPVYLFVSNDWDDPDNPDSTLTRQEQLHELHPELKLTHFVGPYTFTDPKVTPQRAELLASWVKGMRDKYGDEIGLHIHPWCSFVEQTSVKCLSTPSFAKSDGDATGYTVVLSSYAKDDMATLLVRAKEIFAQHGLGTPTSFRAGGWTAEIHTLQALADKGFVADASAANWRRMEEWKDVPGTTLYAWNQEHWVTINDTSQPYYPSQSDMLESSPPVVPILEVPDNGLLVDYVTADEMIEVFQKNWDGTAALAPRMVSIGYHPPNFGENFKTRIHTALSHIDQYLASQDKGPVIYARLSDLPKVWKQ